VSKTRPPRITIRDVAREAGVSIATVSRVLQQHESVAAELRERVTAAVGALGFQPDAAAQMMRQTSSKTICCAVRNSSVAEFAAFAHAAERVLRNAGYIMYLSNTEAEPAQEIRLIQTLIGHRVDGLIMARADEESAEVEQHLRQFQGPVVYMDRSPSPRADAVVIDHRSAMRQAVSFLVMLGHRRIALLTGQPHMRPGRERIAGYEQACREAGIAVDPSLILTGTFEPDSAFRNASLLMSKSPRPTALISGGLSLLPGVLGALRAANIEMGRDVSVIAGCDTDLAQLASPPVTAIHWDVRAWGATAAELLLERIRNGDRDTGRQVNLPCELIVRSSCAAPNEAFAYR